MLCFTSITDGLGPSLRKAFGMKLEGKGYRDLSIAVISMSFTSTLPNLKLYMLIHTLFVLVRQNIKYCDYCHLKLKRKIGAISDMYLSMKFGGYPYK